MADRSNPSTKALRTRRPVIVIVFDMTKAFEKVSHLRFLNKNAWYGILDHILSWLSQNLPPRSQAVQVDSFTSELTSVTSSAIQSNVLGHLPFLLYVNDVFSAIHNGDHYLFAHGIKIDYTFHPGALESTVVTKPWDVWSISIRANGWMMTEEASWGTFALYPKRIKTG